MWTYIIGRPRHLIEEFGQAYARRERRRAGIGALIYMASSGVAVVVFYAVSSEGEHDYDAAEESFKPGRPSS